MNLFPCTSLQKGVKILAFIDMVLTTLVSALIVFTLVALLAIAADKLELEDEHKTAHIVTLAIALILCFAQGLLAILLFRGAKHNNYFNCRIWVVVTIMIVLMNLISLIADSAVGHFDRVSVGSRGVHIVYKIYEILVVYSFTRTLSHTGEPKV